MMMFKHVYEEESDALDVPSKKSKLSVFSPKLKIVRLWNLIIALLSLVSVTVSLFELFFNSTIPNVVFTRYCLDVIFMLNIISRFYIGYESHGVVITDSQQIRWTYLRTWFIVDLLSVLPLETLRFASPTLHFMHFNRCLRVLRLFYILSSFSKELDTNKIHVEILKSFSIVVICVQVSACLWFNQACKPANYDHPRRCPKMQGWLNLLPEFSTDLIGSTDLEYYAAAVYWSVITLTTVGYGEIHAMNLDEAIVASVVMVIGLVTFLGIIMTGMSSIISNLDRQRGRFYHRIEMIHVYMQCMDLPEDVQAWVKQYYHYLWIHQKGRNFAGLLDDLHLSLRMDVSSACYKTLMKKCELLKTTDDAFTRALALKFETQTFSPGQILAKPREINQNLYYIEDGLVQVFGEHMDDKIATLLPGSLFGEVYLMYKIPRNATICTETLCEISVLKNSDLLTLFADYPEAGVQIAKAAKTRLHNVQYSVGEAFYAGKASTPQDVVFHKDQRSNLDASDEILYISYMESVSSQLTKNNICLNTNKRKFFWQKTIRPESDFAKVWEVVVFWSITVSIFLETWIFFFTNNQDTTGFYSDGWGAFFLAICCVVDVVAATDIFVQLHTEVLTKNGYISDLSEIFKHYRASGNLYYDVLAVFPLDFIAFFKDDAEHWTLLSYVRLNRLLWLRKIYLYFSEKENRMELYASEQRTAKCIFLLIFSVHCCSGLFYISACNTLRCDENSWAWNAGLKTAQSNFYHYMYAAYFSTTTITTGYGDIVPSTKTERLAAGVVALVGLFVFNYFVSQIYATLSGKNSARVAFQNLLSAMTLFMVQHDLSVSLQKRVIEYMSLLWTKYQGEAHPRGPFLMHDLPVELQQTVLIKERGKLLSKIPYFEEAGHALIKDLASSSVMYYFPRGEIIQYSESITRELFCIRRGTCQVLSDDLSEIVGLYGEGMYFGEAGFFFGKQALMTVRAKTYCEILVIDFQKVSVILESYPVMKSQIEDLQTKSEYFYHLVKTVGKFIKNVKRLEGTDLTQEKNITFKYHARRYARKSKCYIEEFGKFPIYAGAEEETVKEKLQKYDKIRYFPPRPRSLKEHFVNFVFISCPSVCLMRNAILPSNRIYIKWEFIRILLAITVSMVSSLLLAFLHYKTELWVASYVLLFFCWVDIYIRCHVAFYEDKNLTIDTLKTAKHYMKSSFFLDFISCFPWEILLMMSPDIENGFYGNNEILHLYSYMRAPHILQVYRIPLAFSFWQSGIATEKIMLTFLQFILYGLLFLHFTACILFTAVCPVADINGDTTKYLFPLIKHNCTELSWVSHLEYTAKVNFETATFFDLYSMSLYFATATLCGVGFGDIHPYLTSMKIIMIFIMIAGALVCGLLSGSVAAILANADATRSAFTEKMQSIKLFLKSKGVTGDLYSNTLHFFEFTWIRTKGIKQDAIFEFLPSSLLGDISTVMYADVIIKAFGLNIKKKSRKESVDLQLSLLERKLSGKLDQPLFHKTLRKESMEKLETDGGFIRMLARHIRPCLYRANDFICRRGDFGSEMYFIYKGEVDVLSKDGMKVIIRLRAGQYFGEGSLLFAEPRATTVRAATDCDLYVLSKKDLDETIKYYPDICNQIKRVSARKKDQLHQSLGNKRTAPAKGNLVRDTGDRDAMPMKEEGKKGKRLLFTMSVLEKVIRIHNKTVCPENIICVAYQYTSCLLIIISFWAITYMPSVFDLERDIFLFTMIIEYFQMIEIIMKFHICYFDNNGSYISDYKSVSRGYMTRKIGYVFDLICSFPYGFTVLHLMHKMAPMLFLPLFVHARTVHLLRIVTAYVFMWKEEQLVTTNLMSIRIIKNLVNTIFFVHITAVVLVVFVTYFGMQSWVNGLEIYYYPDIYKYAVYWTLTTYTTTGYGDIKPSTLIEILFITFIMILSKVQVNYNMGRIASAQTNKLLPQVAYEEKLQTLQTYMRDKNVPPSLQNHVIQFYNYQWTHEKGINSKTLFQELPQCMKADIFSSISITLLFEHPLLKEASKQFLRELSTKLVLRSYISGQYIKKRGDKGSGMNLIVLGNVKVHSYQTGKEVIEYHSAGASLGTKLLLKEGLCRDTAIAQNYVDIFFLYKESFDEVGSYYPYIKKKLLKKASEIEHLL